MRIQRLPPRARPAGSEQAAFRHSAHTTDWETQSRLQLHEGALAVTSSAHQGRHSCHSAVPQSAAWQGGRTEAALHSFKNSPKGEECSHVHTAATPAQGLHPGDPTCSLPGAQPQSQDKGVRRFSLTTPFQEEASLRAVCLWKGTRGGPGAVSQVGTRAQQAEQ